MTVEIRSPADFTLDSLRRVIIGGEEVRLAWRQPQLAGRVPLRHQVGPAPNRDHAGTWHAATGHGQFQSPARPEPVAGETDKDVEYLPGQVTRGILFSWLAGLLAEGERPQPAGAERVAALLNGPPLRLHHLAGVDAWLLADALNEAAGADASWLTPAQAQALASASLVGDSAVQASGRLDVAERIFALSVEAYKAPLDAYDEALGSIWADDPYDAAALSGLHRWLADAPAADRLFYQAPVSYRILPRVLGQAHRAVATTEQLADPSPGWNSPHESPDTLFYALTRTSALDMLAAAWADLATLAGRHMAKLLDGTAPHLPDMLMAPAAQLPPDARSSTSHTDYAIVQAQCGEKARQAACSSFLPSAETGGGSYHHSAAPTLLAYEREQRSAASLAGSLAVLAIVASQALFVTGRPISPQLQELVRCVRAEFPPAEFSRPAGRAAKLLRLASVFEAAGGDHTGFAARIRPPAVQAR